MPTLIDKENVRMMSKIITGGTQDRVRFRVSDQPLANEQQIAAQYSCHVICSTQSEKSVASSHTRDVQARSRNKAWAKTNMLLSNQLDLLHWRIG